MAVLIPAILIVILSIAALLFVDGIAPPGRQQNYGALAGLGVIASFAALLIEHFLIRGWTNQIADPNTRAFGIAFVMAALPEEGLKLGTFLLWFGFQKLREPRTALVGGVATAIAFHAVESVLQLAQSNSYAEISALGIVIKTIVFGANGLVIGVWTAVATNGHRSRPPILIAGAFVAAVLVRGLWDTGALIVHANAKSPAFWSTFGRATLHLLAAAIVIEYGAIAWGIRRLKREGVHLRWPPRMVWR